jgi:hypothetical protein
MAGERSREERFVEYFAVVGVGDVVRAIDMDDGSQYTAMERGLASVPTTALLAGELLDRYPLVRAGERACVRGWAALTAPPCACSCG